MSNTTKKINLLYTRIEDEAKRKGFSDITSLCKQAKVSRGSLTDLKYSRSKSLSSKNEAALSETLDVPISFFFVRDYPGTENGEKKEPAAPEGSKLDVLDLSDLTPENRAKVRDYFDLVARSQDK
mgnify:FL=1